MSRDGCQQASPTRIGPSRLSDDELRYWVGRVHRLPVVRVDRIVATRDALQRYCYDDQRVLATTIDRVIQDVGILCRREMSKGNPSG